MFLQINLVFARTKDWDFSYCVRFSRMEVNFPRNWDILLVAADLNS